ncbi:MAG: molybdopterin molybdotransferase MoeA [Flavobacteriales bacterium]
MISVAEAKRIVLQQASRTPSVFLFNSEAISHFLGDDVFSPEPYPRFDMSAVDGYAVCGDGQPWAMVGSIAAGEVLGRAIEDGECVRIFTGAPVPMGADRVVMQEQCVRDGDRMRYDGVLPVSGANIRRKGESVREGEMLLPRGTRMDAAAVGLLASVGLEQVEVHAKPLVSIVRTGNEFIGEGENTGGRIHSSNEWMLQAALIPEGILPGNDPLLANDNAADLRQAILDACAEGDVVVTTGGASVGDHDLIKPVLEELGAVIHFHGVAQKPGKPMLFATVEGKPIFALPGNPRAVLVLFFEYVLPFLHAIQGATYPGLTHDVLPLTHAVQVKGERAEFRAARVSAGHVTLLADEGSHMLRSMVGAGALAYLPADKRSFGIGDPVEVHYLPR